ncbi:hypothetical protein PF010_g15911 [Phytophthora fragariae]|uniref:Uncharacterized protein n=1 Tax=Phytophthora fragariae TaxID=53985 RepID=A0A6G0KT48_9STRA|nr:hypothetical protein PF010_g15911 [Phytophthora fragariae]KAE9194200.1 hypothetical protein PF004_g20785 [Phytophthora fragariae]
MTKDVSYVDGSSEGPASPSSLLGTSSSGAGRKRDQDSGPIDRASATSGKRPRKARSAKPTSNARMTTRPAAKRAEREASLPSNAGGSGVASGASGDNDCEAASVVGVIQGSDDSNLTLDEVEEACKALQKMFDRQKDGKRQIERRRPAEKFKLSSSQIALLANRYKAARNRGGEDDYEKASRTMNFDKFTGHADKLKAYEGHVISMLKKALQQKRALDAGCRKKTHEEGTEELVTREAQHLQDIATLPNQIPNLEAQATSDNVQAENRKLQNDLKNTKNQLHAALKRSEADRKKAQENACQASELQQQLATVQEKNTKLKKRRQSQKAATQPSQVTTWLQTRASKLELNEQRLATAQSELKSRETQLSSKEEELEKKRVAMQEQEQEQNNERRRLKAQRFMLDKEIKRHEEMATTDKQAHETHMMEQEAMLDEIMKKKNALALHESLQKTAHDWKQKCIRAENEAAEIRASYATLESLQDENRFMKKIVDSLDACCSTERRIDDFAEHRVNDFMKLVL